MPYGIQNHHGHAYGISEETDGSYTALTATKSRNFKTLRAAARWLQNWGYNPDGSKMGPLVEDTRNGRIYQVITDPARLERCGMPAVEGRERVEDGLTFGLSFGGQSIPREYLKPAHQSTGKIKLDCFPGF